MNLSMLVSQVDFSAGGVLTIEALAPLSMVAKMPGKYYRSQSSPTDQMLYGLLENALGWHIADRERADLMKRLQKIHKYTPEASGVGFMSLLQFHVRFKISIIPSVRHFQDLWAQHLKGASFAGGSRNHDYRAIAIMNAEASGDITLNDRADADRRPEALDDFQQGQSIHLSVIKPYFPQYYISPTPREYVMPDGPYQYRVETSALLAEHLANALENPAAPLYLGSNDGWVDVQWRALS